MMKARHTLVLSIIAGSVGAAEIQSFRGQAKPKIHRVVMIIVAALGAMLSAARAETPVERGGYLVNAVMACDGCHTPRPPGGAFDMSKRFSGGSQTWDTPQYLVKGSNISPDPETGIGKWSADDFKRALTEGVRPSAVALAPQMPFVFYKVLTPRDLDAVTTYVRSVIPVRNEVQPPVYRSPSHGELIPGAEKTYERGGTARAGSQARLLSRNHCPLHGMSCAAPRWYAGLCELMGAGRIRIQGCLGRREGLQHHLASN